MKAIILMRWNLSLFVQWSPVRLFILFCFAFLFFSFCCKKRFSIHCFHVSFGFVFLFQSISWCKRGPSFGGQVKTINASNSLLRAKVSAPKALWNGHRFYVLPQKLHQLMVEICNVRFFFCPWLCNRKDYALSCLMLLAHGF